METIHSPPNHLPMIDHVWMFVSLDDNGEGIIAAPLMGAGSVIPLIAADDERLNQLRAIAHDIARTSGRRIKLLKFTLREEIEEIGYDASR